MTKFIFLRGYVGTLNVMDGETYATASFHEQTPEGVMGRRRLYHTDRDLYDRLNGVISHEQYMRNRDMLIEGERIRRLAMVNHSRETDNQIRLYQATRVTTVNPKWWMKVKIILQESWLYDPIGVIVVSTLATIVTIIGTAKILSIW